VEFDLLHGAANEVVGRLQELGLAERGSIMLENVDTALSALADRVSAKHGRYHEITPVWAEIEAKIGLGGTYPPSWFALLVGFGLAPDWFSLVVALLAGVVGVLSLTEARASTLIGVFISVTTIPAASDVGVSLAFGSTSEAGGSALQLLLNVTVLAAVATAGLPLQRSVWERRSQRRHVTGAATASRSGG
jgi:hypothetical protein